MAVRPHGSPDFQFLLAADRALGEAQFQICRAAYKTQALLQNRAFENEVFPRHNPSQSITN